MDPVENELICDEVYNAELDRLGGLFNMVVYLEDIPWRVKTGIVRELATPELPRLVIRSVLAIRR